MCILVAGRRAIKSKMRLVTHNMLKCNIKGVGNGYPLIIQVENMEIVAMEYNPGLNIYS